MYARAIRHYTHRVYFAPALEEQGKKVTTSKRAREVCVGENAQPYARDHNLTLSTRSFLGLAKQKHKRCLHDRLSCFKKGNCRMSLSAPLKNSSTNLSTQQ